jgi:Cu(I)/Ag(I) efflux system membrane fusion protein
MNTLASRSLFKRSLGTAIFVGALALAAVVFRGQLVAWFMGQGGGGSGAAPTEKTTASAAASTHAAPGADADSIDHYTCPMHPSVKEHAPGKCPICGMQLVPVTKQQQEQGVVLIDEARRQLIGVRTAAVVEAPLKRSFRAVGRVTYDESTLTDVTLKVGGFITKLFVSRTGQRVKTGQTLFTLYSPDLFSAEQDYLLATQGTSAAASPGSAPNRVELLGRAARQRLKLLGLGDAEIDLLAKRGTPSESIAFPSPASGFVIEKDVVEGGAVDAGMRLYRIAALDKVWVEAEVYEADLAHVRVGQAATVTLDYLPGRSYEAKVAYIYPFLDPTARTGKVRVELANKELELRPGMYANVELASDPKPGLQVPVSAVVYTGPRRLVFVDVGEGRFRPQEIRIGTEADGMYEVLDGLTAGDQVATSGVFLIAAEARISTAAKYWENSAPSASVATTPEPAPAPVAPMKTPTSGAAPKRAPMPSGSRSSAKTPAASAAAPAADIVWTCPMHPEVQSDKPGQCPKCGMTLVQKPKRSSP